MRYLIVLLALLCVSCGTALPSIKPYKLDVQQGNVVTSKMLLQLRPGMTKSQVRFIMGTPLIQDSFHGNRWDYVYQMRESGKIKEQRRVILDFENDLLKSVRGDVIPAGSEQAGTPEAPVLTGTRVVTPISKPQEKGLLDKLKFWESDDKVEKATTDKAKQEAAASTGKAAEKEPAKTVSNTAESQPASESKSILAVPIDVAAPPVSGEAAPAVPQSSAAAAPAPVAPSVAAPAAAASELIAPPAESVVVEAPVGRSVPVTEPEQMTAPAQATVPAVAPEAVQTAPAAQGYQSESGMQFDRKLEFEYESPAQPVQTGPRSGNKTIPEPKPLPQESDPSYFDRMLEYIGF